MYSIKAVAVLTGLNAETIRAWERRYQAITPRREANGRRYYSEKDVERLTLLAKAVKNGHAIGKVSGLKTGDLSRLAGEQDGREMIDRDLLVDRIVDALSQYRIEQAEELLLRALLVLGPLNFAQNILSPAMNKVGALWHDDRLTAGQEHMFSACVKRIVLSLINNLSRLTSRRPSMMFTTLSGEIHEFGILMTSFLAANLRCRSFYLGPDLAGEEIAKAHKALKTDIVVLSIIGCPPNEYTLDELRNLAKAVGSDAEIWIGGSGARFFFQNGKLPEQCSYIEDLNEFHQKAERLSVKLYGSSD
ncbi:MAG: MerR family transcriptional regulator [Gammaproteobacteria bacterium]